MLAERLVECEWPKARDLPTAAVKSACIDVTIYTLAAQADKPAWERTAPRGIWFVVDRRLLQELGETQREQKGERKIVDFGIGALDARLHEAAGDLAPYLASVRNAPLLLSSHVDLLCQTSPRAQVEPDIQLYLHGGGRGVSEVRVAWRADLDHNDMENWPETIALCPPNSGETVSVEGPRGRWIVRSVAARCERGRLGQGPVESWRRLAAGPPAGASAAEGP